MRPRHAGDELAEEERGGDGAGVAAADVLQIGDSAPQLLPILAHQRELPELLSRGTAGGDAGAITAALFLGEFVTGVPWAHLDIAGPAFGDKDGPLAPRGATGYGVRLLVEYLRAAAGR